MLVTSLAAIFSTPAWYCYGNSHLARKAGHAERSFPSVPLGRRGGGTCEGIIFRLNSTLVNKKCQTRGSHGGHLRWCLEARNTSPWLGWRLAFRFWRTLRSTCGCRGSQAHIGGTTTPPRSGKTHGLVFNIEKKKTS